MGGIVIAFAAALLGVFVMQSALQGDRRLVISATAIVVAVSAVVTALNFTPASWPPLIASMVLIGLIYAAIGALAGAVLDKLAATYLMRFLVMTDIGVVQTPMFHETPPDGGVAAAELGPFAGHV